MTDKSCDTCQFGYVADTTMICQTCVRGGIPDYPNWKSSIACLKSPNDPVHSPKHYQLLNGVEVIDVRRALLAKMHDAQWTHYQSDCWSRAWGYLTRAMAKNGLEDLRKCRTYLDWLIKDMEA